MKLIFIRHGQTEENSLGLIHKTGDGAPLDNVGRLQALKTALRCQELGVETLYSSSETRARETGEIIAKELKIKPQVLPDLKERDWGAWAGKPWGEIKEILDKKDIMDRYTFIPPEGESWQQMEERLKRGLASITTESHDSVAIITHNGALRSLIPLISGKPLEASVSDDFKNGSITIFDYNDPIYTQILFNDTAHLE
jgi:broad specificity phosphatase PhoE